MSSTTIFGDTSDGVIASGDASYANARAGTGTSLTVSTTGTSNQILGQALDSSYIVDQPGLAFDTSTLGAWSVVSVATLSLFGSFIQLLDGATPVARVRGFDWGSSLTTGDYVPGASLTGYTLLAHSPSASWSSSAYWAFTNDAMPGYVNVTGMTRFILTFDRIEAGTTPTNREYLGFYLSDATGTTNDPKLDVTYSGSFSRTATEGPTTSESLARSFTGVRAITAAPTTSESMARVLTAPRTVTAAPTTSDTVTRVFAGSRTAAAAPTTADAVTRVFAGVRATTESPSIATSPVRILTVPRTTTEAPSIALTAARTGVFARNVTAAPTLATSVTRSVTVSRSVTEAVSVALSTSILVRLRVVIRFGLYGRLSALGTGMGIEVRVYDGADPTKLLAILEGARQPRWYDALGDVGSASFLLSKADPKARYIERGNVVKMYLDGQRRFAYVIDQLKRTVASPQGGSGEFLDVAGRGAVSMLDKSRPAPGTGTGMSAPLAAVLAGLIDDAMVAGRAILSGRMTYDFSATVDSAGNVWQDAGVYEFTRAQSLLDIWQQLVALGIESRMTPDLVLQAFRDGIGRDISSEVVIEQMHLRGDVQQAYPDSQLWTRVWVQGRDPTLDPILVLGDESDPRIGIREGFVSVGTTDEYSALQAFGERALADSAAQSGALRLPLLSGHGWTGIRPYVDIHLGDTVGLHLVDEDIVNGRIAGFTIAGADGGGYTVDADFSATARDALVRLRRIVRELGAGTYLGYR